MNLNRYWNKFWIGLALGIVLPIVVFFLVYLIGYSDTSFSDFMKFSFIIGALAKILSLCAIPNLAIFYLFLNKEYWYATRGIITATILCTLAVVAIKFVA
jgi:hypothetical protein